MLPGPFDKRLKRSRCSNCAARHLKCSKTIPCLRCSQDSIPCRYPSSGRKLISDNEWRHNTICIPSLKQTAPNATGPIKETPFFQQFFDVFLQRNQLTGAAANWHVYLSINATQCRGHFAALAALGALAQYKQRHNVPHPARVLESALQSYQDGVHFLQSQIDRTSVQWNPVTVLSVAFLLSMFELMYDHTGVGWNSHMGFGTSVILQVCGPSQFRSESALAIYRELRLFEISRAALFSQTTILADYEWSMHDRICRASLRDWSLLEVAFDLFLQCVKLQQRFSDFQDDHAGEIGVGNGREDSPPATTLALPGNTFWTDGIRLQSQLMAFGSSFKSPIALEEEVPARAYAFAMLIYLSGIFDHGVTTSQPADAPVMQSQDIAVYREGIMQLCGLALKQSRISSVLLLVPLRITGNRCDTSMQCRRVLDLLCRIERSFAVAVAFRRELGEIWKSRGLM